MERCNVYTDAAAEADIREIVKYIAHGLGEPKTADKMGRRIYEEIFSLDTMPERYPLVRNRTLAREGYRMTSVGQYLIFYTVNAAAHAVHVRRVLYGRQDWLKLLQNSDYREG